eukprot:1157753-Pelagomonas_calceolata.AAC.2
MPMQVGSQDSNALAASLMAQMAGKGTKRMRVDEVGRMLRREGVCPRKSSSFGGRQGVALWHAVAPSASIGALCFGGRQGVALWRAVVLCACVGARVLCFGERQGVALWRAVVLCACVGALVTFWRKAGCGSVACCGALCPLRRCVFWRPV